MTPGDPLAPVVLPEPIFTAAPAGDAALVLAAAIGAGALAGAALVGYLWLSSAREKFEAAKIRGILESWHSITTVRRVCAIAAIGGALLAIGPDTGKMVAEIIGGAFAVSALVIIAIPFLWLPIASLAERCAPVSYIVIAAAFVAIIAQLAHPFAFARGVAAITHLLGGSKSFD